MGIFDRFPYSSTHEMNLDFMLGKATEIAEDMQQVTAGMEQVQAGLTAISEKTEQATQAAAQAAASASSIEGSVTAAEEAAEEAQMHNESAQTWANNAMTYKADCQRSATEAAASSSSAAQAATAAAGSEDTVAQYAQAANASAQSAANNNDSAHQYANQASASASNATFHSSNAQTAATNAQTAATNANTSATNASASADRAASLKTDVETLHRMCTAAVDQAATEAVNAANSAAQAAATKTDVENLVESLPEDFTDLNNTVNQLSDEIDNIGSNVTDLNSAFTDVLSVNNIDNTNLLASSTLGKTYNGNVGSVYSVVDNGYRCATVPPLSLEYDISAKITINEGYRVSYRTIDPDTGIVLADSGWITGSTTVKLSKSYVYGFSGGKNPDSTVTLSEYLNNVSVIGEALLIAAVNSADETSVMLTPEYLPNFKAVNHRGFNSIAPENTIPAFILSKKNGFRYVEADVRFTSDDVPVILHDASINRTARNADGSAITGTVNIADITYAQALEYDFGIWKGEEYAGTKIPTLNEFINLCKAIGLTPRIEFIYAPMSTAQLTKCLDIVNSYGMLEKCEYNCNWQTGVNTINSYYDSAVIVWGTANISEEFIAQMQSLKTEKNKIIINANYTGINSEMLARAKNAQIPVELYTVDSASYVSNIPDYVSGITSNNLNFAKLLFGYYMT